MTKSWVFIVGLLVCASHISWADSIKSDAPPKVVESTRDADKAAVHEAASESDRWAATHKEKPAAAKAVEAEKTSAAPPATAAPKPETTPPPDVSASAPATTPAPPETTAPPPPPVRRSGLNEMRGTLGSVGTDPKTLRLSVDGGYNVEFTYDSKTAMVNGGSPVSLDDLNYGDELIVRYSGKELKAIEIDRVNKASRPQ